MRYAGQPQVYAAYLRNLWKCFVAQVLHLPEQERVYFTMCAPRAPLTDTGMVMAVEGNLYQVGSSIIMVVP